MSNRANMTMVGLFVVAAIGLGVGATVVLGSGALFRDTFTVFTLFDGSVQGLQEGAPVVFRGVPIGTVEDIRLFLEDDPRRGDTDNADPRIPVVYHIDRTLLQARGGLGDIDADQIRNLVDAGLSAQLLTESFVTGRLIVSLDFRPEAELVVDDWPVRYSQIPSVPTPIEEIQHQMAGLFDKLEDLDIQGLMASIDSAFMAATTLLEDPELRDVTASLDSTLGELDRTMVSFREVAESLSDDIHTVAGSADDRAQQLETVLAEAEHTMATVREMLSAESPLSVQMGYMMQQLGDAARALRVLSEAIEQNPSVLIRGRAVPEGN